VTVEKFFVETFLSILPSPMLTTDKNFGMAILFRELVWKNWAET
jgi:hypothetical protein